MRKTFLAAFCSCAALLATAALAQLALTYTDISSTVGTTQANCVGADSSRRTLVLQNTHATNNIGYCFRASPSTPCTPSLGAQGTYTIQPGQLFFWPAGSAPINGMDCIASGANTVLSATQGK